MKEVSYSSILPLVSNLEYKGNTAHVTFTCPVSQESVQATATVRPSNTASSKVRQGVQNSVMRQVRYAVLGLVRSVFGSGTVGRMARDVANNAIPNQVPEQLQTLALTEDDKQRGVVEAFQSVASRFTWDAREGRWISAKSSSWASDPFSEQLAAAPIDQRYDQGVMARMIVEIARADGRLSEEERAFLAQFIPHDLGDISDIAQRPQLSSVELDETTRGPVRETMLLLAWTIALTDESLDASEAQRLGAFAQGLAVSDHRAQELKGIAQSFIFHKILERAAFTGYDQQAVQNAMRAADQIGMNRDDAQRAEVRFRKAQGML